MGKVIISVTQIVGASTQKLGCFTVVWWIGEVEESFIHIVVPVHFAEETRLNKFQPNPNRSRGPTI